MPGRDEALERARLVSGRQRSLSALQEQFTQNWFPGGEAFQEPVIRIHDAAHQWSNIAPTARGELQQNILDLAGTHELYKRTDARGFVNSVPFGVGGITAEDFDEDTLGDMVDNLVSASRRIDDPISGSPFQAGLPVNSPARLQVPPIGQQEAKELMRRGKRFYGEVGKEFNAKVGFPAVRSADPDRVASTQSFKPAPGLEVELPVNAQAQWIHEHGDDIQIKGGYDTPGGLPYGPMESRLNRPLQYTVDEGLLMREAAKSFRGELTKAMHEIQSRLPKASPKALQEQEMWVRRAKSSRYGLPDPVATVSEEKPGTRFASHDRAIADAIGDGANAETSALGYVMRDSRDPATLHVAARARDLTKVKNAVRIGSVTAADVAGSVPLFDPGFRQAVERGDAGEAVKRIGVEYATGAAAAPVVGTATGILQRVAPGIAARALPAIAAVSRVANPVAVVSQLGGDAKQDARKQIADRAAAQQQLLRAEAARRRGGRWSFPTPFGKVTLPELGISEAGGLFFR